ncbi:MAG: hypothetical protein E7536_00405 [Ruminococcaceae bacterium]|nr:hypothetical protein [Oscillospiraceae bacterium]
MKKIIAILLAIACVFVFVSCSNKKNNNEEVTGPVVETTAPDVYESQLVTEIVSEIVTEVVTNEEGETEIVSELVTDIVEYTTLILVTEPEETATEKRDYKKLDPSEWRKDEIIDFYKTACNKSTDATSTQYMFMRDDTLTADGGIGKFLDFAEDTIIAVMEKNSIEFDGITGGYKDLSVSDCKQANAYKEGNYTVIEMVMYDQVDDAYGNKFSGSVGHAITVVDGVAEVAAQFPLFDVAYEDADIKITYSNAILKVKINNNGVIEKGTWSYVVAPAINNLYIENLLVNNAGAVIDYKVTVGGGF